MINIRPGIRSEQRVGSVTGNAHGCEGRYTQPSPKPILALQVVDTGEFSLVVGNESVP